MMTIVQFVPMAGSCCAAMDVRGSSTCNVMSRKFLEFPNHCTLDLFLIECAFK